MAGAPEIVFRLVDQRAALPLRQVREVILPEPLIRVPRATPEVLGVMNVRGRVVLVVDAGLLLGEGACRRGSPTERILILDPRRRDLGLWVSEVLQIAQLEENAKRSPSDQGSDPESDQGLLLDAEQLSWGIAQLFDAPQSPQDMR